MCIECTEALYVIALSLQIAGSLMVVSFLFSRCKRKSLLRDYINSFRGFDGGEETENGLMYNIESGEIHPYATESYKNIVAFIYILFGYMLSVFGESDDTNRFLVCFFIFAIASLLLGLGKFISDMMARIFFAKNYSVYIKNGEIEVETQQLSGDKVMDKNEKVVSKSDDFGKRTYYLTMIIAGCSLFTFLVLLICALVVVPKAVKLIGTAQTTLENMEEVSEKLTTLKLSETIQSIDDSTARAMQDVSDSMEQIQALDVEALNESIEELKESVENLNRLFK